MENGGQGIGKEGILRNARRGEEMCNQDRRLWFC